MKTMEFSTPWNYEKSVYSGWTRDHWNESFERMFAAIHASASPWGARQRLKGARSHHGLLADELEGFTRSFIMAGPWLMNHPTGVFTLEGKTYDVGAFYRKGILAGTDPHHEEYWGDITDYAQHLVEMASLSWALYQGKKYLWDLYSDKEKKQVSDYLNQCNRVKYHQNNWLLFNVVTNTVLKKLDMPYSQENLLANLKSCDHMYMGEGWYRDGDINRIDYYNSWGFHYYYLIWVYLDGDSEPELAKKYKERVRDFVKDFRYFFATDGSVPEFGRSMTYRFGYLSSIAMGYALGALDDIDPGEIKTMMDLGIKFYLEQPVFTDSGHLNMGFVRPSSTILEHYSCGGSPYWAVKAFNILLLPEEDKFWQQEEKPLPIHLGNYSKGMKQAGLILNGNKNTGHVQLINNKSFHDNPEYNGKYTNFAYSSDFSYESGKVWGNFNCDNALQYSEDRIHYFQRWKMESLYLDDHFCVNRYKTQVSLGKDSFYGIDPKGEITSAILIKDDFYLSFHKVSSPLDLSLQEGGYPLGYDCGCAETQLDAKGSLARCEKRLSFIQNLYGWEDVHKAQGFNEDVQGSNSRYSHSLVPKLGISHSQGKDLYLAALVCGRKGFDSFLQLSSLVSSLELKDSVFYISFYDGQSHKIDLNNKDFKKMLS